MSVLTYQHYNHVAFANRYPRLPLPLLGRVCLPERTVLDSVLSAVPGLLVEIVPEVLVPYQTRS